MCLSGQSQNGIWNLANFKWLRHSVYLVIQCCFYGGCFMMDIRMWYKYLHSWCPLPHAMHSCATYATTQSRSPTSLLALPPNGSIFFPLSSIATLNVAVMLMPLIFSLSSHTKSAHSYIKPGNYSFSFSWTYRNTHMNKDELWRIYLCNFSGDMRVQATHSCKAYLCLLRLFKFNPGYSILKLWLLIGLLNF